MARGHILGLFCALVCISLVRALASPEGPMQCQGKPLKTAEEAKKKMQKCVDQFSTDGTTKTVPKEKVACFGKCIMKEEGVLDDSGKVDKDKMMELAKQTIPDDLVDPFCEKLMPCIDDNNDKLKMDEDSCASYAALTKCMTTEMMKFCSMTPGQ